MCGVKHGLTPEHVYFQVTNIYSYDLYAAKTFLATEHVYFTVTNIYSYELYGAKNVEEHT